MDKAMVFCEWRVQLRAWRAWRTVIWEERKQREVARIEEALRIENRQETKKTSMHNDSYCTYTSSYCICLCFILHNITKTSIPS